MTDHTPDGLRAEADALTERLREARDVDAQTAEERVALLRDCAERLVALRKHFFTETGAVDWGGRTYRYRMLVSEIYSSAGIRGSERQRIRAAIGYHIGNVLHRDVSREDLDAAGIGEASPRERSTKSSQQQRYWISQLRPGTALEPERDPIRPLVTVHTLLSNVDPDPVEGTDRVEAEHWIGVVREDLDRIEKALRRRSSRRRK